MSSIKQEIAETLNVPLSDLSTAALILAAGNSTRMGMKQSKQFLNVGGMPVLAHTLLAYQKSVLIREIIVAARPEDFDAIEKMKADYKITKLKYLVAGGSTRQESARKALAKVSEKIRYVAIADGARCLVTSKEIDRVCLKAYSTKAASAAARVVDTVKRATVLGNVTETVDRTGLWTVQTPQVFHLAVYAAAQKRAVEDSFEATDDNALVEHLGYRVHLVECSRENIKITTKQDLPLAEAILAYRNGR